MIINGLVKAYNATNTAKLYTSSRITDRDNEWIEQGQDEIYLYI